MISDRRCSCLSPPSCLWLKFQHAETRCVRWSCITLSGNPSTALHHKGSARGSGSGAHNVLPTFQTFTAPSFCISPHQAVLFNCSSEAYPICETLILHISCTRFLYAHYHFFCWMRWRLLMLYEFAGRRGGPGGGRDASSFQHTQTHKSPSGQKRPVRHANQWSKVSARADPARGEHAEPAFEPFGPLELSHCRLLASAPPAHVAISGGMPCIQRGQEKRLTCLAGTGSVKSVVRQF